MQVELTRRLVQDGLRGLALVAALLGPACTPLVNADRFRNVLGALEPAAVEEGEGGPVFSGRGVPLLLLGGSFDDVKVSADDTRIRFSTPMVADGAMSVLAWIPALPELGAGETATVTVTVGERTFPLLVHGLPELSLAGMVDARGLAPRYSEIRTSGPVTFTGDAVPFLVASGSVVLEHPVSVAASGTRPGPGGAAGGAADQPGPGARGGAAGAGVGNGCAGGGAGGGGSRPGTDGADGAQGGAAAESLRVVPPEAFGGQGGGGGGSSGEYVGRDGGGGGGVLVVEGAVLQVAATLDAHGAAGDAADGSGCGQDAAGAGGGGSGGAIWLRARDALSGAGEVDVQGGVGGAGGQKAGGDGAPGFVRVDAPEAPRVLGEGALFRGPAWRVEDPRLDGPTSLPFTAQPGAMLALSVDGAVQPDLSTADAQGEGAVQVDLPAGLHTLCLALAGGAPQEVAACMRVASL